MEVYISIDMEGVAGIAHMDQVVPGARDYERCRLLMTHEATAAVAGAFDGGATVRFTSDDYTEAFRCLLGWNYLTASVPR